MSDHWYDANKRKAAKGFADALERKHAPEQQNQQSKHPKPPYPQLTPNGPLRGAVDRKVREERAAEIAKRKEEIARKFASDRLQEKNRSR